MTIEAVFRTRLAVPPLALRQWHLREGALERLIPPWSGVRVVGREGDLARGGTVDLSIPLGPFRVRWHARHGAGDPPTLFIDEQERGPFRSWRHEHRIEADPADANACWLEDRVTCTPPLGLAEGWLRGQLARQFAWRHRRTTEDLARHHASSAAGRLTIAVSGASGLVATSLIPFLTTGGHEVRRIIRAGRHGGIPLDAKAGTIDGAALADCDAVIHLAGAGVADQRWSAERKAEIRASRIEPTRIISEALAKHAGRCRTLVVASAVGIYGNRGDEALDEMSAAGTGFLAGVCREWEAAAEPARAAGIRVVHVRIGVVLAYAGGALASLRTPFALGLGGPIAGGRMWLPWIALDDLVHILHAAAIDPAYHGVINAVAPTSERQGAFARTLGRVLHRPAVAPMPAFAVRALFGEMGSELLLSSAQVAPAALHTTGFRWAFPELEAALRWELGR